jgi:hypothetical protein
MQRLEDIGFYTLSDERAANTSVSSPLHRCELILTHACNFKCPYCRGLREDLQGTLPLEKAKEVVRLWISQGLRNVRFSGGEPLLYKGLDTLVAMCKEGGVEHIAISSNGSFPHERYVELIECGVNDLSISLDGCCATIGDKMTGVPGAWDTVIDNIRRLSKITYITVGMVFTEENVHDCVNAVLFADALGVSDIRVIPSAQYNLALAQLASLGDRILDKYPILRYRINNVLRGAHVRGMEDTDNSRCPLVLDDMAVAKGYHFPCIIYMREMGDPIGKVGPNMRQERAEWLENHDCQKDTICKKMCLDVCRDYNNRCPK